MGEGRYRTLLCLMQLAVAGSSTGDRSERIELVDPLAEDLDAAPLAAVLADPAVEVVVHAGRQDVALLRRALRHGGANVFDTQVAAGFAGMGRSAPTSRCWRPARRAGAKSASFTRWDARPLSAEQLAYAREDVVHLLELAAELERRLDASGRLQWAREECEPLERSATSATSSAIFARLPRIRGLSASSRAVARELVEWRERTAAATTGPCRACSATPRWWRSPSASRPPRASWSRSAASAPAGSGARRGAARGGRERARAPARSAPAAARVPAPRPDDAPLIALSEALVRARAREAGLAYELLAARADLQAIVAAHRAGDEEADVRTLRGWRRELVGEELLELLDGRLSLSVRSGKIGVRAEADPDESA